MIGTLPPLPRLPSWHVHGQLRALPVTSAAHFALTCTLSSVAQRTPATCWLLYPLHCKLAVFLLWVGR